MIKAYHSKAARAIFNSYIDSLLRKNFSAFYLVNGFPQIESDTGIIVTPNHFSWWDGFLIDYLNRKTINRSFYIMMLEEQLRRYWFFRYVGAYSINPASIKSIIETSLYTAEIASSEKNMVIIYPQGEITAYDKRPVCLKDGTKYILKQSKTCKIGILPVFFKIQYEKEKLPSVYTYIGRVLSKETLLDNFNELSAFFNKGLNSLDKASFENKDYINLLNK